VASPPACHEHDHNSNHDLINYIGILSRDDTRLPLARSLFPIPTAIFIPGPVNATTED